MVPKGWSTKSLAEIVKEKISYGIVQAGPHIPDGVPYIKSSDVRGSINPESLQRTSQEIHFKYRRSAVHPGDIVFSLRGNIGESSIVPDSLPVANLTQGTARISVSKEHCNQFHYYQLASEKTLNRINALSKGSTFKEISLEELRKVKVLCAPLPEQKKIAKILSTWDQAICTTEQLLVNSQQQKKVLMQQLLTGKKRLLDKNGVRFSGEWHQYLLEELEKLAWVELGRGKVISKKDIENIPGNYPIYSSSVKNNGLMGVYGEYMFDEELISWSVDGGGDFFYRPKHKFSVTNVSGYMRINKEKLNYQFIAAQLELHHSKLEFDYQSKAHPSVIRKAYTLTVPDIDEQQKIASVLTAADQEIETLQCKLECLKQEKKALMQQLLTGKRRVQL